MQNHATSSGEILAQLERIIASLAFRRAGIAAAFLRFAVERSLSGNSKDLKEYTIAVEVLRRPASYDPQIDSHVRVQAAKLRERLTRYYETEGKGDPIVISLPKGSYVPDFQVRAKPGRRRWMYWSAAAIAGAMVAFAVWSGRQAAGRPSLAVIELENATGNPENDYVAAAIGDHVRNSFSQREDISTVGRDTMARYRNRPGEANRIGRQLGVQYVLSGRVSQQGDRLSVQAELTDPRTASQIWGSRFEGQSGGIVSIAEEVSRSVAAAMGVSSRSSAKWANADAYQSFLKGRYFLHKRSPQGFRLARQHFAEAIAKDSRAVEAYAALTDAMLTACFYASVRTSDALPEARRSARTALALAPGSAAAHVALGFVHHYELDEKAHDIELDIALRLDPTNTMALRWKGLHHMWAGRHAEARPYFDRAIRLDPLSVPANVNLGELAFYSRDYGRAAYLYRQVIEMDPSYFWAYERLGQVYEQMGKYAEAIVSFKRSVQLSEDPRVVGGSLGHAYAVSGQRSEAEKLLKDLVERSRTEYVPPYGIAVIYAGLRDSDQTMTWLHRADQDHSTWLSWLRVDPRFDLLRKDKRFEDLLDQVRPYFL